jgi:acyl carrier protein
VTPRDAEVLAAIRQILATELDTEAAVEPHAALADCEALDSLGLYTLAVGLEDRFRVRLAEEDAPGLKTFADVIQLVNRRRAEADR